MHILSGTFKNRSLIGPKGNFIRPTSSRLKGAVFNICQNLITDARFLDAYAGTGNMGLEALSRGACSATFIDNHKDAIFCIKKNIGMLGICEKAQVIHGDVTASLKNLDKKGLHFEICYLDPPYSQRKDLKESGSSVVSALLFLDISSLLTSGGLLFIEDALQSIVDNLTLQNLKLKDKRCFGDSALRTFLMKE